MKTLEIKALEACQKYVVACDEVKSIGKVIGLSLSSCQMRTGEDRTETCLVEYYNQRRDDADITAELCEYCKTSDMLIQKRKKLRIALGVARRQITRIGKFKYEANALA